MFWIQVKNKQQDKLVPSKVEEIWPKLHTMFAMSQDASQRLASLEHKVIPSIGEILSMRPDVTVHQPTPPNPLELTLHDLPAACNSATLARNLGIKVEIGAQVTQKELDLLMKAEDEGEDEDEETRQKNMKKKKEVLETLLDSETGKAIQLHLKTNSEDELLLAMQCNHPRDVQKQVFMALTDFQTWVTGIGYSESQMQCFRDIQRSIKVKAELPFPGPEERNKAFEDRIIEENQIMKTLALSIGQKMSNGSVDIKPAPKARIKKIPAKMAASEKKINERYTKIAKMDPIKRVKQPLIAKKRKASVKKAEKAESADKSSLRSKKRGRDENQEGAPPSKLIYHCPK